METGGILIFLWVISLLLILYSYLKFNYVSTLDVFVVSGWFFTFFRPIFTCDCDVNLDLYHWDAKLYNYGTVFGAFSLILFQIGYTSFSKSKLIKTKAEHKLSTNELKILYVLKKGLVVLVSILIILYTLFRNNLFYGFNEVDSAISLSVPGLEYGFRLVGVSISILIPVSLLYFYRFGFNLYAFLALLLSIVSGLIFGKRGMLVSPILIGFSACTFFSNFKLLSFNNLAKSILTVFVVVTVGFYMIFGKVLKELPNIDVKNININCLVLQVGMQEFDLLWPATIEVRNKFNNLADLPVAMVSGLYFSHSERMKFKVGSYHSITDKTMLLYNHDAYVYQKFGISPNTYQFYYSYFGVLSLFVILLLGFFLRKLELNIFRCISNFNFYKAISLYFLLNLFISPFDITLKYYLLDFFILFIFSLRFPLVNVLIKK